MFCSAGLNRCRACLITWLSQEQLLKTSKFRPYSLRTSFFLFFFWFPFFTVFPHHTCSPFFLYFEFRCASIHTFSECIADAEKVGITVEALAQLETMLQQAQVSTSHFVPATAHFSVKCVNTSLREWHDHGQRSGSPSFLLLLLSFVVCLR